MAAKIQPTDAAFYHRAVARAAQGRLQAAERDLKRILASAPNNGMAVLKLAEVQGAMCVHLSPFQPTVIIDHSAYPHILDQVIAFADPVAQLGLWGTCSALRRSIIGLSRHCEIRSDSKAAEPGGPFASIVEQSPLGRTFQLKNTLM